MTGKDNNQDQTATFLRWGLLITAVVGALTVAASLLIQQANEPESYQGEFDWGRVPWAAEAGATGVLVGLIGLFVLAWFFEDD